MGEGTDSGQPQGELQVGWRVVIVLVLLTLFGWAFTIAALQSATIKRLEDTDFKGYTLFSLIATVETVDQALAEINQNDVEIREIGLKQAGLQTDNVALNSASLTLNQAYRDIFTQFLSNSGSYKATQSDQINKAVLGEAVRLDRPKDDSGPAAAPADQTAALEAAAPAADPASNPAPTPAPAAASAPLDPVKSLGGVGRGVASMESGACPAAVNLYERYAALNQNIPGTDLSDVVQSCLIRPGPATISPQSLERLNRAQADVQAVIKDAAQVGKELNMLSSRSGLLMKINEQLKAEIGEVDPAIAAQSDPSTAAANDTATDAPPVAASPAQTPLQIRNKFPEITNFRQIPVIGRSVRIQPELVLGILTLIAGAVGGASKFALSRFSSPFRRPDAPVILSGSTALFVPTVFSGTFAGLSVFLILFGGLAVFQVGGVGSATSANYSSFAAIGYLSGMFSERVNAWLESIAGNFFSKARPQGDDPAANEAEAAAAPANEEPGEAVQPDEAGDDPAAGDAPRAGA